MGDEHYPAPLACVLLTLAESPMLKTVLTLPDIPSLLRKFNEIVNMPQLFFINKDDKSEQLSRSKPSEQAAIQRFVQKGRKRPRPKKPLRQKAGGVRENGVPSLHLRLSLSKQDPFNASVVKLDSTISGLLHYYVYYYHPALWPNEIAVLKAGMYTFHDAVKSILQTVVANEMMMYCLLSAASCRMHYIDNLPSEAVTRQKDQYISSALRLMSRHVSSSELKEVLICIMFMLSTDSYRHEMDAAKLHLKAATRLLKPLGGITAVEDEALQGQLAMGDLFLACVHLEPCLFDCSYNPGPARLLQLSSNDLLPYQPLAQAFGDSLREHIDQLAESYSIKHRLRISEMTPARAMQATRWITKRCMAIRHDLLGLKLNGVEHALRVALIMWSLLAMNVTGRSKTVKVMAPNLQAALIGTKDWRDPSLRQWILLLGYQCAEGVTMQWYASELYQIYLPKLIDSRLGRASQADVLARQMVDFQEGYFYDEVVQQPRTYELAIRLLEMDAR